MLRSIDSANELAASHEFLIDKRGTIVSIAQPSPEGAMPSTEWRAQIMAELQQMVDYLRAETETIDDELNAKLRNVMSDGDEGGSLADRIRDLFSTGIPGPPGGGRDPKATAEWWKGLSEDDKLRILEYNPEMIRNLDGVPAEYRDKANRALLPIMRERLAGEFEDLFAEKEAGGQLSQADAKRAHDLHFKLQSLDSIDQVLTQGYRYLLTLDVSGERAEAAIANGDVDNANHVAVFTPGLTSTIDGSMSKYDNNMADVKSTTEHLLRKSDPTATVATVTWIGYQAPQLTTDSLMDADETVLDDKAARAGAAKLARFLDGLDAARADNPPHLTALGHSYGSVVTGHALQHATAVDDAVIFGSPGPGTDRVSDLNVGEGRILSIEANKDPVADLGRFGADPTTMDGMRHGQPGAVSAEASPTGQALSGVEGHSGYFTEGSTSQHNMAAVVAGRRDLVVEGRNVDAGDLIRAGLDPYLPW